MQIPTTGGRGTATPFRCPALDQFFLPSAVGFARSSIPSIALLNCRSPSVLIRRWATVTRSGTTLVVPGTAVKRGASGEIVAAPKLNLKLGTPRKRMNGAFALAMAAARPQRLGLF